jgi:hypothetical protein
VVVDTSKKIERLSTMIGTDDMKKSGLEFSRPCFLEPESIVVNAGYAAGHSTDQSMGAKMLPGGASSGDRVHFQPWDTWLSMGIPELASPLAG